MEVHPKSKLERLHDLKTVHTDFSFILQLLNSGHPFRLEEEETQAVLNQLKIAVGLLKVEIQIFESSKDETIS